MSGVLVEIRAGEGGRHSELLVVQQFIIYSKMGVRRCL